MLEKIKGVSNPLTIIALFAGIAEIASTAAIFGMSPQIQLIFVWFVMLFPTLLVVAFFVTLNWNSTVLYAPSDYRDDQTFMDAVGRRQVRLEMRELKEDITLAERAVTDEAKKVSTVADAGDEQIERIRNVALEQIEQIKRRAEQVNARVEQIVSEESVNDRGSVSSLEAKILKFISDGPKTKLDISLRLKLSFDSVSKALSNLRKNNMIVSNADKTKDGVRFLYDITETGELYLFWSDETGLHQK